MNQCVHQFELDQTDGQVRCKLCGDLDDEMQLANKEESKEEKKDLFYKSQESFE